jgi:hypothetical protein
MMYIPRLEAHPAERRECSSCRHKLQGDNGRNDIIIMQKEHPEHLRLSLDPSEGANSNHGQMGVHISVAMGAHIACKTVSPLLGMGYNYELIDCVSRSATLDA